MEVKINREIRNYTESMFFGLTMRQFVFSLLAVGVAVGVVLSASALCGNRNRVLDVCAGGSPLCGAGLRVLPRHDRRAVFVGVVPI